MDILLPILGVIGVIVVALIVFIARYYHRVPPNEVYVVFGSGEPRYITNGGVFVKPIIESYKKLDMTIMTIKTQKDEVYTISGIPIQLDWVAQVQIDSDDTAIRTAARAFLDKKRDEIRLVIEETLSANFRAIVGQMTVETIHRDRDDFIQRVQELATDDVAAMGVRILSMGIEEILDNEGYLQAMAAPQIAAVKRDAKIAEAEAEREARVKAAEAMRLAEQAELNATREILQQREALSLREVEVNKRVDLDKAQAEQEVQKLRALAVEQQQEAEVLVPARAEREAIQIRAEGERKRIEIAAEAEAMATRKRAEAEAEAVEKRGRGDASALEAMKRAEAEGQKAEAESVQARLIAEAEGQKAKLLAEAESIHARLMAEAEGQKAKLLAEAEGRHELAAATAAEDSINLRQFIIETVTKAEVAKVEAMAQALAGLGNNVRVVQIGNGSGDSNGAGGGNTFLNMLMGIPEVAEVFRTKVEALSGEDFNSTVERVAGLFDMLKGVNNEQLHAPEVTITNGRHEPVNPATPPDIESEA